MKPVVLAAPLVLLFAGASHAQSVPYNCQNDPVSIDIPAQPLPRALDTLSEQTRCPISRTVDVTKSRGNAVKGRMTPANALVALVRGTGIEGHPIKQGLTVDCSDQQEIARRADALDRRIRSRRAAGHLSAAKAVALRRQVGQIRQQAVTYARGQGFVSAAEKASFRRTLDKVGATLGA